MELVSLQLQGPAFYEICHKFTRVVHLSSKEHLKFQGWRATKRSRGKVSPTSGRGPPTRKNFISSKAHCSTYGLTKTTWRRIINPHGRSSNSQPGMGVAAVASDVNKTEQKIQRIECFLNSISKWSKKRLEKTTEGKTFPLSLTKNVTSSHQS